MLRLRAQRKIGVTLREMPKNEGARGVGVPFQDARAPTYRDLGIDYTSAYRWQQMAELAKAGADYRRSRKAA